MRPEVEAFWDAEKRRNPDNEAALWAKVDKYEAALFELAAMCDEHEKLVKHRSETGEGVDGRGIIVFAFCCSSGGRHIRLILISRVSALPKPGGSMITRRLQTF